VCSPHSCASLPSPRSPPTYLHLREQPLNEGGHLRGRLAGCLPRFLVLERSGRHSELDKKYYKVDSSSFEASTSACNTSVSTSVSTSVCNTGRQVQKLSQWQRVYP
jgi:hypothetical protein